MKKYVYLSVVLLFFLFIFISIFNDDNIYPSVTNVVENYDNENVFINKNEEYIFDIEKQFAQSGIKITKYVLTSSNEDVAIVRRNKVIGKSSGKISISGTLYSFNSGKRYFVKVANVFVINPEDMIEIKTADDLININNNNTGNYILKNDIDLKSFSPWQPIDLFSGMFVNPEGYVIRNLTISSANEVTYGNDKYRYCKGGLFRTLEDAYIDGILLENININISDFEDEYRNASAGGITVSMLSSTIRNCHVTGTLQAQFYCGGIVGSNSWGYILDSSFSGTAKIVNATEYGKREVGVGGIVGRSATHERAGLISNCNVNATILGHKNAGGVVGYLWGSHNFSNCSFEGTVIGEDMMEIISFDGNVTMSNDTDNYSFLLIPEYTGMYTITSSQSLKYQILDGNEILKEDTNKLDYYVKKNNLYVINILKEDNIEAQIRVSPMFISQGTLNLSDLITEDNDIILSFQPSTTGYYGITLDINLENPIFESNMIKLYDDKFNQIKLYVPDRNLSNLEGNNELFYYMKTDKYYYISISNSISI